MIVDRPSTIQPNDLSLDTYRGKVLAKMPVNRSLVEYAGISAGRNVFFKIGHRFAFRLKCLRSSPTSAAVKSNARLPLSLGRETCPALIA
jgi:hypothetical protein